MNVGTFENNQYKKNIIGFLKHLQCIHRQSVNKQSVESIQFKCLLFFGLALFYVTVCCTINRIMQRYTQVNLIRHANIIRMTIVLGMLPKSKSKYNGNINVDKCFVGHLS